MDAILTDVFAPDLFTTTTLTAAINQQPYLPGRIAELGIFEESGIETTSAVIESNNGSLTLVPNSPRGAAGKTGADDKRKGVSVIAPHLQRDDTLLADSVLGVRLFGSGNQRVTVEAKRNEKLAKMGRDLDYTLEYHRIGAIQGIVLDSDGTTPIFNAFTAFGVSEPAEVDFDLDAASPVAGIVRKKCDAITRSMSTALGAQRFSDIWAPCGDDFWDMLVQHTETRATYLNQAEAAQLRTGTAYNQLRYGGILFENYRGYGSVAIGASKCRFVAVGVPDLFITRFAPADYLDAVNTTGLPKYSSSEPMKHNKGLELEAQSNPINLCSRPLSLLRAKNT